MSERLENVLIAVGRRHARAAHMVRLLRSVSIAFLATSLVRTVLRLYAITVDGWLLALLFASVAVVAAKVWAKGPLNRIQIARMIDDRLDLKDRLATAVEYHGQSSHLLFWLFKDADQQSRFVDPRRVVPFPPSFTRRDRLLGAALAATLILWIAPIPAGILAQDARGDSAPASPASGLEAGIDERIEALRMQLQVFQSPQVDLMLRDLEALQTGLRERTLPQDEAVALLEHLERRWITPDQRQAIRGEAAGGGAGLDRIQDLASRIASTAESLEEPGSLSPQIAIRLVQEMLDQTALGAARDELQRALEQLGEGDRARAAERLREAASLMEQAEREWLRRQEAEAGPGSESEGEAGLGESPQALAPGENQTVGGEGGQGEQGSAGSGQASGEGASATSEGLASPGEGALPEAAGMSGAPSNSSGSYDGLDPFQPRGSLRQLFDVRGQTGSGPLRSGTVHTSLTGAVTGSSSTDVPPSTFRGNFDETTTSVEREAIPRAYRDAIREYFRILEPASDGG